MGRRRRWGASGMIPIPNEADFDWARIQAEEQHKEAQEEDGEEDAQVG